MSRLLLILQMHQKTVLVWVAPTRLLPFCLVSYSFKVQLSHCLFLIQLSSQIQMAARDGKSSKGKAMQGCRDFR